MKKKQNQIMMMMESVTKAPQTMAPFLLLPQTIISSMFDSSSDDKSLFHKYKLLQIIHYLLSLSLFFLRLFLSLLPSIIPSTPLFDSSSLNNVLVKRENNDHVIFHEGDSSIARALSQMVSIMNEIPVTSRKYEIVRCLAEKIIDENIEDGCDVLLEVNRTVLSNAFAKTLSQLEMALVEQERERANVINGPGSLGVLDYRLNWVWNAVRVVGNGAMNRLGSGYGLMEEVTSKPVGWSAEKFAAEILWLAQKLAACGNGEDAVCRWGSASNLALLAVSADPRIQCTLVKVSAFLFKQAKETALEGKGTEGDETKREEHRQRRMMMLTSWLPFLCRASNGTDAPILSNGERKELERVLEETIEMLRQEDEQEKVLALWLHHFTSCPSSDWPNLQTCYARWCDTSRKVLASK